MEIIRSIWAIALPNNLTEKIPDGHESFSGNHYTIQADPDNVLTLIHNDSDQRISISADGNVLHHSCSLPKNQAFQTTARAMLSIANKPLRSQPQQMQP